MGDVVVVGAGLAGLACARELAAAGVPVRVLDRGRRPGGRLGVRRTDEGRPVEVGPPALTTEGDDWLAQVRDWEAQGLLRPWPAAGAGHWAAPDGLRALADDLARGLDVVPEHEVRRVGPGPVVDGEPASAVVLAMPAPQALRLTGDDLPALRDALGAPWEPTLVLAGRWPARTWRPFGIAGTTESGVIARVVDDGDRLGDGAPVLAVHTTAAFAAGHLDDPAGAAPAVLSALDARLGCGAPEWHHVHRWTFAAPAAPAAGPFLLLPEGIGACGEGWGGTGAEAAWRSGVALGRRLAAGA